MNIIEKKLFKSERSYGWVLEVLIFATVTPALIYGVLSLGNLRTA